VAASASAVSRQRSTRANAPSMEKPTAEASAVGLDERKVVPAVQVARVHEHAVLVQSRLRACDGLVQELAEVELKGDSCLSLICVSVNGVVGNDDGP
jgi:hypothetical protein